MMPGSRIRPGMKRSNLSLTAADMNTGNSEANTFSVWFVLGCERHAFEA
jgi:hypothetical protein